MHDDKFRREFTRWLILLTLSNANPVGASDSLILDVVRGEYGNTTRDEIRREIMYLVKRKLVEVTLPQRSLDPWQCALTRYGIDVAEYTVDCLPGIARPHW